MTDRPRSGRAHKGRGAVAQVRHRFDSRPVELTPDEQHASEQVSPETVLEAMTARSIISHNNSPDIPFDRSINPYVGCEHGCVYCYARPSHSYLDLSPGLDFETRIFYKPNAVERLLAEWERPGYVCAPITLGANTDPYQPAESRLGLTRQLLEVFLEHRHPVSIITKGTLLRRDLDLLHELAAQNLCSVAVSVPTLDNELKRILEPRVPAANRRLQLLGDLVAAGVPATVMLAPVIPAVTDREIESIIEAAAAKGVARAAWILLRLPHELEALFTDWLHEHLPERAAHVLSLLRQAHGGKSYDSRFGHRQRGAGAWADMIAQRFRTACRRHGIAPGERRGDLDCSRFRRPGPEQFRLGF